MFHFISSVTARWRRSPWWLCVLVVLVATGAAGAWASVPVTQAQQEPLYTWSTVAPAPLELFEAQGAVAQNRLYLLGGFYNTQLEVTRQAFAYNPDTNSWQRLADMPEQLTHAAVVADGDVLYVLGGYVGNNPGVSTNHVWKYTISTNTWGAAPSLPADRGGGGAAILGRSLHFFGGASRPNGISSTTDSSDHWVLSLDGGTSWSSADAPLPNPRNHMAGIALNGKIYAIGGQLRGQEGTTSQDDVHCYDPVTNQWSEVAAQPTPRSHIGGATFVLHGEIFVVGGSTNDGGGGRAFNQVASYNPTTNRWTVHPPLPDRRKSPVAGAINGRLVVTTGKGSAISNITWLSSLLPSPSTPTPTATDAPTATATPTNAPDATPATSTATSEPTATSTATSEPTATSTATSEPTATSTATLPKIALLVVGATTLSTGDSAVQSRLQSLGYTVTVKAATAATVNDASGKTLVVVSSSVSASDVTTRFTTVAVPVLTWEYALYDDLGLTGTSSGSFGRTSKQTQLAIISGTHPLAAGLSGTITVYDSDGDMSWGVPASDAVTVARLVNTANQAAIFGYEAGTQMVSLRAPARRVGFFFNTNAVGSTAADGWKLFDAAVVWAVGNTSSGTTSTTPATSTAASEPTATSTPPPTAVP